jgi:transposase
VLRRFTHLPLGHRPTWLQVATPRYECAGCGRVWRHRLRSVARRRSRLTRAAGMSALAAVVLDHVPVSSVARVLGVAWHTAHTAVADLGRELLIGHPARLDGVHVFVDAKTGDPSEPVLVSGGGLEDGPDRPLESSTSSPAAVPSPAPRRSGCASARSPTPSRAESTDPGPAPPAGPAP